MLIAGLASCLAGAINSVAGGGTLLTFPTLIAIGLDSKTANATSTVGLVFGSVASAWGYRREIGREAKDVGLFFIPSLLGGIVGAWLLFRTDSSTFKFLVPYLILTATILFMAQAPILAWLKARRPTATEGAIGNAGVLNWCAVCLFQFGVAVYGGYFGAGIGILMLACLGFLGIDNIHRMNGIKNVAACCINGVAALLFILFGMVDWPVALVMAATSIVGGYLCSRFARKLQPITVRRVVIVVGIAAFLWTLWPQFLPPS